MGGQQERMSKGVDWDIHCDLQVEWILGNQGDIHVLLNDETIQFSYSQGEQGVLLNVKSIWGGQGVSPSHRDQPCPVRGQSS